ncbi:MAG: MarR family transcriptional regulator [Brevinematales bacterium]|jgi:MarR family transcriptional regulator for hemolysin
MLMKNVFNENFEWLIIQARKILINKLQNRLKESGVSIEQLFILDLMITKEGCNQTELAEGSQKDGASITRMLDILEKKNLVRRGNSPEDRREFLLFTTDKGKAVYHEAVKLVEFHAREIESIFSEAERVQFKNLLNKLISEAE